MPRLRRLQIRYQGLVQGVGFRATVRHLATTLPAGHRVSGWVCNLPGGDVLMQVQGEPEAVAALEAAIADRWVDHIRAADVIDVPLIESESGFSIRR
jgi:acylphosphatase